MMKKVQPPDVPDLMKQTKLKTEGASYHNGVLDVTAENGGIDLIPEGGLPKEGDYYVGFYLKSLAKDQFFNLRVNDYVTSRKSNESIYKTGVYDLTIRVPKTDKISIRLPKGKYQLDHLSLHQEDYQLLKKRPPKKRRPPTWTGGTIKCPSALTIKMETATWSCRFRTKKAGKSL